MTDERKPAPQKANLLLYLLIAGLGLLSVYAIYLGQKNKLSFQSLNQAFYAHTEDQASFASTLAVLNEAHASLQTQLSNLSQQLNSQRPSQAYDIWASEQARYYLELANIETKWGVSPADCVRMLQLAERLLKTIQTPSIQPVIQTIEKNIQALQQLPQTNIVKISQEIYALEHKMHTLIKTDQTKTAALMPDTKNVDLLSVEQLKQLFKVKHYEPSDKLVLSLHETILVGRIEINLLEMRLALLQKNKALYELGLKHAMNNSALLNSSEIQKDLLVTLQGLAQEPVFISIPPITEPLNALNNWISNLANNPSQPVN